jgi:hypothetical protein
MFAAASPSIFIIGGRCYHIQGSGEASLFRPEAYTCNEQGAYNPFGPNNAILHCLYGKEFDFLMFSGELPIHSTKIASIVFWKQKSKCGGPALPWIGR